MIDLNSWHPMPRYGVAAAFVSEGLPLANPVDRETLWSLASKTLPTTLESLMLRAQPTISADIFEYRWLPGKDLNPGKAGGQTSAKGYFIAPHVLTSNNAADIVKEVEGLRALLKQEDKGGNYELKKSFAPMISKLNAGKKSMSNPKVDVLHAAFTAIASLTEWKPSAYVFKDKNNSGNTGIIPDLPFHDEKRGAFPLAEFIRLFRQMQAHGFGNAFTGKFEKGKFLRPAIFQGNYPEVISLRTVGLGSLSLVAAIGKWVEEHQKSYDEVSQALLSLAGRPIYIVSNEIGCSQERFHHHLVRLTLDGTLYPAVSKVWQVSLLGVDDASRSKDARWLLFLRAFDQFLRFFDAPSFQHFLMYRASYPIEFFHLFKTYFQDMENGKYSDDLIKSAVAYGRSLNRAAYLAAKDEIEDDQKKGNQTGRKLNDYKHRTLLELESIVGSAQTNRELVARLNSQVGRLTFQDVSGDASLFLTEVANEKVELEDAQHLITAFMRLSTYDPNQASVVPGAEPEEAEPADELGNIEPVEE